MAAAISAAAIGAGTSIGMGVAQMQSGKSANSQAGKTSMQNTWQITNGMNKAQNQANALMQPYYQSGLSANDQLNAGIAPGGQFNQPYGMDQYKTDPGYTPMVNSLQDLQNTPGYQFQLQQGQQGLDNQAAARGGLLSGKQLKATSQYQQGVASQGYQSAWDRAQTAYQSAFSRNQSQSAQRFTQLNDIAGRGFNAGVNQGQNIFNANNTIADSMTGNTTNQMNAASDNSQLKQGSMAYGNNAVQGLVSNPKVQTTLANYLNPTPSADVNTGANTNLNNTSYGAVNNYLPQPKSPNYLQPF